MIDVHCHIDLYENPKDILEICEYQKIFVFSMTNLPSHFEMGLPFFQSKKYVRMSLGMHPLYANFHKSEFLIFEKNLDRTSYIGEIGLDFSKEGIATKNIQIESLKRIFKLVSNKKKILSLHSRKAEKDILELLIIYKISNAIFHWYSGGLNLIKDIADAGYYFSINPAMTKSVSGQKIISKIPKDKILTETDGPFIIENNNIIKPGQVESVITYLANHWDLSEDDVIKIIQSNFKSIVENIR